MRVIFQDVDGCLNPSSGEDFSAVAGEPLSREQVSMLGEINDAVEASSVEHFVINTGRFWPIVKAIADCLPTTKLRYFLLEHAAVVYDRQLGECVDLAAWARDCGLLELAQRYERAGVMAAVLRWYDDEGQVALEKVYGVSMPRLDKAGNLTFAVPAGLDGADVLSQVEFLLQEALAPGLFAVLECCRSDRFIDILPGIHKMDGITLLCAHLGVPLDEVVAVGDFLNDLSVFEALPQVMCPANAHEEIKALTRAKGARGHVSTLLYGAALVEFLRRGG